MAYGDGAVQPTGNEVLRRAAEELGKAAAVLVQVALVHHHDVQAQPVCLAYLVHEPLPSIADKGFSAQVERSMWVHVEHTAEGEVHVE